MAFSIKINPRDSYSICGLVDGTVTAVNKETNAQIILCTFTAGNEAFFSGSPLIKDNTVTISDDNAIWAPRPFRAAAAGSSSGGGEGGTSAGFGVPTAEATALAPGAQPTVAVSASGSNSAKIFNFSFGIPQGAQGEPGAPGEPGAQGEPGAPGANGYDLIYTPGTPAALISSHVYDLGELAANVDLSNVSFAENSAAVQTCEIWLANGATAYSVTWPGGLVWLDSEPVLEAGKYYRFALRCEPNGTIIGNLAYEYSA